MQTICQGTITTIEKGIYQLQTNVDIILFLAADIWGIEEGTYCVIESPISMNLEKRLRLYGNNYSVLCNGSIKALIKSI